MNRIVKPQFILITLIVLITIICYDGVFTKGPLNAHIWRKTDCLSFAHHYMQGASFLEPEMHIQNADALTSGKTAGEFPLLYYVVGKIWQITGEQYWVYRLIGLLLMIGATFSLFQRTKTLFGNSFWAIILSIGLFCAPVFVLYGVSFLTDVPAFCLVLMGLGLLHRGLLEKRTLFIVFAWTLIALGGLLKISSLIPIVFLALVLLGESFGWKSLGDRPLFTARKSIWIGLLSVIFALISWYSYAAYYNSIHGYKYTFNSIYPLWQFDLKAFSTVWANMRDYTSYVFFSRPMLFLLLAGPFCLVVWWKKFLPLERASLLLIPLGGLCYFILWAPLFGVHDYYYTPFLWLYLGILIPILQALIRHRPAGMQRNHLRTFAMLFVVYNLLYSIDMVKLRTTATSENFGLISSDLLVQQMVWMNTEDHHYWQNFVFIQPYLKELGITEADKIISIPDDSDGASLYFLGLHGWTDYGMERTPEAIEQRIEKGAHYLFVSREDALLRPEIASYTTDSVGFFNGIHIFRLR